MTKPAFDPEKNLEDLLNMEENAQQNPEIVGDKPGTEGIISEFNFDIKPEELESYLNQYVVDQEGTIEVIATKVCTHFNRMKIDADLSKEEKIIGNIKSNMLLIGPTGVGKTYIVKLIASKIGVPFVKADATKFSETGYVGGDVEDLVRELVHESEGDINKAEYGIIYIDEIDKIASTQGMYGPDVSRTGVQRNLLKLMEEAEVDLKTPHDLASQVEAAMEAQRTGKVSRRKINTRNILFIVSGAFGGLEEIINKRLNKQAIGFDKVRMTGDDRQLTLKNVRTEDLIEYGFESEFVGRLPVYVVLNELNEDGLFKILKNKYSSVVIGKKLDFRAYEIELTIDENALRLLADRAHKEKTGARGLISVFEKVLIKYEKILPSTNIRELHVTKDVVENPDETLKKILIEDGIHDFQKKFLVDHGIFLEFSDEAVDKIQEMAGKKLRSITQLCNDLFHDYYHGLRLMNMENFTITPEAAEKPKEYLNNFIKDSYNSQDQKDQQ